MNAPYFGRMVALAAVMLTVGSCALFGPGVRDPSVSDEDVAIRPPVDEMPPAPDPADPERPRDEPDAVEPAEQEPVAPPETVVRPDTVAWEIIASGQQCAIRVPVAREITDAAFWADVWAAVHANVTPQPERPEVDFSEQTVVLLILGERRTGGYSVGITRVVLGDETANVRVQVDRPAPGAMVTQALTSPWTIATIPVARARVRFTGDRVEEGFEGD